MNRNQSIYFVIASSMCLSLAGLWSATAATNQSPRFEEVYKLLQEHASDLSAEELNRAAVTGLLDKLGSTVSLVTNNVPTEAASTNLLAKSELYEKHHVYLRINQVGANLADKISQQVEQTAGTNQVKGLVLDLRFCGGDDFSAAAKTADQFVDSEQPLLDWGTGSLTASKKTNAITVPVAVLVNRETRGAAEALAAILRETKVGLLLGSSTAGQASVYKDFPLQDGQRLRIATAQLKVAGKELSNSPLKPDIEVNINRDDERAYFEDPFKQLSPPIASLDLTLSTNVPALAETNRPRSRINEAELVRRKREGLSEDEEFIDQPLAPTNSELTVIRDPALARAIDLLKGIAVIRSSRPL
jgi:hypothetical protein